MCIIEIIFLIKNITKKDYKNSNIGNNISNKTLEQIEEYIKNISEYELTAEITIESNKNTNKYKIKQIHNNQEDKQEVLEPENIKGVTLSYKNGTLEIKNTKLNLNKIQTNYPYIYNNNLWLNSFIEEYKTTENKKIEENDENIIITVENKTEKIRYKELYIDKKQGKITKLLLQDNSKKTKIYILYTEITVK